MGISRVWVLAAGLVLPLLLAGCKSGGGTAGLLDSFFGGGSSGGSNPAESLGDLASGGLSSGVFSSGGLASAGGLGAFDAPAAATLHHPEPANIALFSAGLAGLAVWRRRKTNASRKR